MKRLFIILIISACFVSCQNCDDIHIYGETEEMLLDSLQKKNVKTGCDVCDEQIQKTNINNKLEKLNTEFTIAKGSYSYYNLLSNLKGINYYKKDRLELTVTSNNYKDSLTITQLKDSIQISFIQEILGGCIEYIPNIIYKSDSLIIRKMRLPDLDIRCHLKKMSYEFSYYACLDVTESIIIIDRKLIDNQKLFFQPYKNLIFNIPTDKDTVYFNKD
ncbi:MAG: hypothetical protein KDD29_09185 [Flavobacteriales bacterium]|nr:hypothetical protein [Flavobacteriales bacterium]